jgi:hypothetical protein
MSTSIYLFKTHQINISNLALAQALENAGDLCLDRCYFTLEDNKFFKVVTGKFVNSHLLNSDFRYIDWETNIDSLNLYIQQAKQQKKFLIFGTALDDQINFLKKYFGDSITTIGVDYTESIYQKLLYNLAEYHLYKLKHNLTVITDHDRKILSSLSVADAVSHYANSFDQLALIPHSNSTVSDYNILINDFADKNKMSAHYNDLSIPFTDNSQVFYDTWSANQSTI